MTYHSTRGAFGAASGQKSQPFSAALLTGLAPDGGLLWPVQISQVSPQEFLQWRNFSYAELAFAILSKFIDDIDSSTLRELCDKTYRAEIYCHTRPTENAADITPLTVLGQEQGTQLSLLALSNGPTLAFKDIAMQMLGNLFEHVLHNQNQKINILGATSGDTGSAAEYAMRGKQGVRVFMLSPHGRMSAFQQAQMFSLQDDNIFNISLHGVFDDCQDLVKRINEDLAFKTRYHIAAVNSINFGRILAQVVYYWKAWFAATREASLTASVPLPQISFAVPSGNFGNVLAGHIARRMGLPIRKLIVATNENNVLDTFFRSGVYRVCKSAETQETSSPSMDISKASNFERFVFDLLQQDAARTRQLFEDVEKKGGFDLSSDPAFKRIAEYGFVSGSSTHAHRLAVIRDIAGRYGQIIDPHTADGIKVAREYLEPGIPMVVLETAQPVKFSETIEQALGRPCPRPVNFEGIEALPRRLKEMDADVVALKHYISEHCSE